MCESALRRLPSVCREKTLKLVPISDVQINVEATTGGYKYVPEAVGTFVLLKEIFLVCIWILLCWCLLRKASVTEGFIVQHRSTVYSCDES